MKITSFVSIFVIGILSGCADPSGPVPPNLPPSETFTSIRIDVGSAVVAVGDSLDLKATAYTLTGDTLVIPPNELKWGVSDASMLRTDQSGRVHMLKVSGGNIVYPWVRWTTNGTTRVDSAYVVITQDRDPITSIQIRPQGDSARTAMPEFGFCCGVSVIAKSATGDSLGLIRVPLEVVGIKPAQVLNTYLGPVGVTIGYGQYIIGVRLPGPFWLKAKALVYGMLLQDSIQMMGLYPLSTRVTISLDATTSEITSLSNGHTQTVQKCGTVEFRNDGISQPLEVIFDDPSKVSGCVAGDATGNIESIGRNAVVSRKVPSGPVKWTARVKDSGAQSPVITGTITTREP